MIINEIYDDLTMILNVTMLTHAQKISPTNFMTPSYDQKVTNASFRSFDLRFALTVNKKTSVTHRS